MPRSAADATRFTAASPHVYAKPSLVRPAPSTSTYSSLRQPSKSSQPIPKATASATQRTETPHEKVARLRAMRTAQRHAELPLWERTILRGRVIADKAHRFTATGLILFSILATGFVGFAVTDMLLHNRRKRGAFYDQQHRIYASKLLAAIETEKAGIPLTNDQQLVLNRERMKIAADERKKQQSWPARIKRGLFSDLKEVDEPALSLRRRDGEEIRFDGGRVPSEEEVLELLGVDKLEMLKEAEGKGGNIQEMGKGQEVRRDVGQTGEAESRGAAVRQGGLLDQMAENLLRRTTRP